MPESQIVWAPDAPHTRLTVVAFRREFTLATLPERAEIRLFAHSHYHLHVNGVWVGTGPARSGPVRPVVDRYDLSPYLQAGANVVAVLVAHAASHSFHHLPAPAGFVAWGAVGDEDLATPGAWRCCRSAGHADDVPRWSFAIPATEICDERAWPAGWDRPGTPRGEWAAPTLVDEAAWGPWDERAMAPLANETRRARSVLRADLHAGGEQVIGFRVAQPGFDLGGDERAPRQLPALSTVAATWIHSERERAVEVATWWGEHSLNGEPVAQHKGPARPMCQPALFELRAGWNLVVVRGGMFQGAWECELALPADLVVDADRGAGGEAPAWRTIGPLPEATVEAAWQGAPADADGLAALAERLGAEWAARPHTRVPTSPLRHLCWARPGEALAIDPIDPWPIVFPGGRDGSVVVDFGTVVLGRAEIELDAPAGTVVDIAYTEELSDGRPHYLKSVVTNNADRRICDAGGGVLTGFFRRGCRYVEVSIAGHDEPVTLRDVRLREERYPYPEVGAFRCSDPVFTELWAYGVQALRSCSEDVITDCPWRERTAYGGDLLAETAVAAVVTRDLRLVRHTCDVFLDCQTEDGALPSRAPYRFAPGRDGLQEYQLVVLLTASWYLRLSGDVDWAARVVPRFRRMLAQFESFDERTGCFAWYGTFIEHTKVQRSGLACAGNAILSGAFRAWAGMLRAFDRDAAEEAAAAEQRADRLAEAVRATFWDADAGAFRTGVDDSEAPGETHHLHASFYPGCFGCTTAEQDAALLDYFRRRLAGQYADPSQRGDFAGLQDQAHSPYGSFYLMNHCARMDDASVPEYLMRHHYSPMVAQPTGTIWEQFNDTKSLCHAWSAAPTWYLSTQLLGVQLGPALEAPLAEIVIAPMAETVDWAEGRVPHPLGDVDVRWRVRGDRLLLAHRAPAGVPVRVAPRGRLADLTLVHEAW